MHEVSLVRALLQQVERICKLHEGAAIEQIDVEIGPLSGVEPLLVSEAFQVVASSTPCAKAALVIHEVPLKARCQDCGRESIVADFNFSCGICGSHALRITQGDEFRLLSVTLQTHEPLNTMAKLAKVCDHE